MGIFDTRPRIQDRDFRQLSGDSVTLSGETNISGSFRYMPGATNGYVMTSDASGYVSWQSPSGISADTNTFVTGGTVSGTNLTLGWNNGGSATPIDLSSLSFSSPFEYSGVTAIQPVLGGNDTNGNVYSTIGGGRNNVINTTGNEFQHFIGGGYNNTIDGYSYNGGNVIVGGGNLINNTGNLIRGGSQNFIGSGGYNYGNSITGVTYSCVIVGGDENLIGGSDYGFIGGGTSNYVKGDHASVVGGNANKIYSNRGVIGGGTNNQIIGDTINDSINSVIVGGNGNILSGVTSFIGGGTSNTINGDNSTINGGTSNTITGNSFNTIGGGRLNTVQTSTHTSIVGGYQNTVISSNRCVIGGGTLNDLTNSGYSLIGGGAGNYINGGNYCSIFGGAAHYINGSFSDANYGVIGGGKNNAISGSTYCSIAGGVNNIIIHDNSHIIGSNITTTASGTTYVERFNISTLGGGASVNNLGIDVSGNVVVGSTGGGVGVTIDPFQDEGNVSSITWDVSGTSTNYEATLTGNTTLTLSNVRNGDYGTLIVTQDGTGGHSLTFGAGTHKVVNGGAGVPTVTGTANAIDIISFVYNGSTFYWTVGNDYT